MDVTKNNLLEFFSGIAARYDFFNHVLSFNNDKLWRRRLIDIAQAKENAKILDLCCGTADIAIEFIKRQGTCLVYGVDFSPEMLKIAKEKINRLKFDKQINLVEADVFALPFAPGHFDVVSIGFGLRNLCDSNKGIIEIAKMLKGGGRVVILEFSPPAKNVFGRIYNFYLGKIMPLIVRMLWGSSSAYKYLSSSITAFLFPEQILNCMKSNGLKNLRHEKMTFGTVNFYYGEK